MEVWGVAIHVRQRATSRSAARSWQTTLGVAVVSGTVAAPILVRGFETPSNRDERWASQLRRMAVYLENELRRTAPAALFIREMGHFGGRGVSETTKRRMQMEGAILQVADPLVGELDTIGPEEIGRRCGSSKVAVEEVARSRLGSEYVEAGAAAIAALASLESRR